MIYPAPVLLLTLVTISRLSPATCVRNRLIHASDIEHRAGSQRPLITNSRKERHDIRMVLKNLTATSQTINREMGYFARQKVPARTVWRHFQKHSMDCQHGDHGFGYGWRWITDRSTSNGEINHESGRRNGVTSSFQAKAVSIYIILTVLYTFGSIVENAHYQLAFDKAILAHHLKWWYGVPVVTYLDHFLFASPETWTSAVRSLNCYCPWLCLTFEASVTLPR